MIKKFIFLFFITLFLYSCKGIELKNLSPIPTKANKEGILGLMQDSITGDWDRFKEDKNKKEKKLDNSSVKSNYSGQKVSYYTTGELLSKRIYKNGLPEGKSIYYYKNGEIRIIDNYKGGQLDGEIKSYYENGKLKEIRRY